VGGAGGASPGAFDSHPGAHGVAFAELRL
jgi:hypothetical protein